MTVMDYLAAFANRKNYHSCGNASDVGIGLRDYVSRLPTGDRIRKYYRCPLAVFMPGNS